MSRPWGPDPCAVVVATHQDLVAARATVRTVLGAGGVRCLVVDVDGRYRPVADERVLPLRQVVDHLDLRLELAAAAATLEPEQLTFLAGVLAAQWALDGGAAAAVVIGAGVHVVDDVRVLLTDSTTAMVVPASDAAGTARRAAATAVPGRAAGEAPLFSPALYAVGTKEHARRLRELAAGWPVAPRALEVFAVTAEASSVSAPLVTPWRAIGATALDPSGRLLVDGAPVCAVDLTAFDARRPWLLDTRSAVAPRVLLSEHPVLAELVAAEAAARRADQAGLAEDEGPQDAAEPPRLRMDDVLRAEARRADHDGGELPDLLGLGTGPDYETWALALVPADHPHPVARYLHAVRAARPHLRRTFPGVPGVDAPRLARWALEPGPAASVEHPGLLARAAERTLAGQSAPVEPDGEAAPPAPGVNLVGYLSGELGLGESARLVDQALQAAGVPTSTHDVSRRLLSRRTAGYRPTERVVYDTSLVCVNGSETPALARQVRDLLDRTRVIGMWYWELEELPPSQQAGFEHVDEVWAATDFMREAIARHAGDIPVRTVTPPLPQAGTDPGVVPARFGIATDRPWFLFTFDFLSFAERKNPYGLVDAFTRAFGDLPAEQRPTLVIKTINAERQPAHAERLRLQVAGRPDVLFLDTYLDNHERHVLASNCTAFVSLHKAEGLGLTLAEAMAWGKPVITTAYGGVMQFCREGNSFLVGWEPGHVPETFGPYEQGLAWAEPDLEQAAAYMRLVVEHPERAQAVGARAADDIRTRHNAEVAGARMREVLDEGRAAWSASDGDLAPSSAPGRAGRQRRSGRGRLRRLLG